MEQRRGGHSLFAERNLTMLVDFYELTMANGFLENGLGSVHACFDLFFRKVPDQGGYAIMAGLEQAIDYLKNLRFTDADIAYLREKGIFSEAFLQYLADFEFTCDVWAIPEGTPIFPHEPLVTVCGPAMQAQFVETMLLLTVNHQSLIATKASRIVRAADGRPVMEFGSRRAQGSDGALFGARAAYIAGAAGTACAISDREFGVPALGTMAHSWIQMFPTELDAFRAYAKVYPDACTLLVDTYHVLKTGVPNAITVFKELKAAGHVPQAIRIDSGDIAYLSKKARAMLDEAGLPEVKIIASNSLDEYLIRDLLVQGAKIDSFGVGERLVTSRSEPVFAGVYKLSACGTVDAPTVMIPKIKLSENASKITNPGCKMPWRLFDGETGMAIADVITLRDEDINTAEPYVIFDPEFTYKRKTLTNFRAVKLQVPVFEKGKCVYESPDIELIRSRCKEQLDLIWDEVKRFENPHVYYVDLSEPLWKLKREMLDRYFAE
ncbi:MAG: nicotinate phosphoribosyltransferase [Oscillospiraceae bacterium]|nr:nicotinate phosphoribosyltransferase [Oscillospiraceae bacterium]